MPWFCTPPRDKIQVGYVKINRPPSAFPRRDISPLSLTSFMSAPGMTGHGLWLTVGQWDANVDVEQEWLVDRTLLILSADKGTHRLIIDRTQVRARDF